MCDNEAFWSIKPFPANPAGTQMAVGAPLVDFKANELTFKTVMC